MDNLDVIVLNRSEAIRHCHKENEKESVMIAISTPLEKYASKPFTSVRNGVVALLLLEFADVDVGTEGQMERSDGDAIKRFLDWALIDRETGKPRTVIVQCDAGKSRSAGVAAAILKYYTGDDRKIFDRPLYNPNMHCYRVTLNSLYGT